MIWGKKPVKANLVWVDTRVIRVKGWVESEEEKEQGVESPESKTTGISIITSNLLHPTS